MAVFLALAGAALAGFGLQALLSHRFPSRPDALRPHIPPDVAAKKGTRRKRPAWIDRAASFARLAVPASRESTDRLRTRLAQAGLGVSAPVYHGLSVAVVACGFACAVVAASLLPSDGPIVRATVCAGIAGAAACAPRAYLNARTRARKKRIEASLPATLEILAVAVEAGLTLERAFRAVAKRRNDELSREFAIVDEDISLFGYTRDQALQRLAKRCDSEDLSLFASAVAVSTRAGAPVAAVLKRQAASARTRRFQRLEEAANKIPTKMIFPLAFLVMPGVFIVAVSPAVISIARNASEVF